MPGFSLVVLVGHLGSPAELKIAANGKPYTTFSVAVLETWLDKAQVRHNHTHWHQVILWGKTVAPLVPYLTRGRLVSVTGRLQTVPRPESKRGETYTQIIADRVLLLDRQKRDRDSSSEGTEDDVPF
jgi:single-strand DNA-binding protein